MGGSIWADEVSLRGPFGVGVRADGSFYVAEIDNQRISKFDAEGNFVGEIKHIEGYGDLQGPFDVDISASEKIYIADERGSTVLVLDSDENLLLKLGTGRKSAKPGEMQGPHFVTADEKRGLIYVGDTLNHRAQVFDMNGKLLKVLGTPGVRGTDTYHFAVGVGIDDDGYAYIMSQSGKKINVYDENLNYIREISGRGGKDKLFFDDSYSVEYHKGALWIADCFANRLIQITKEGELLKVIGGEEGEGDDQFSHPTDLEFDAQDNIYVADWKNNRVLKLDPTGKFMRKWGGMDTAMSYQPPVVYPRDCRRGQITIGGYIGISKSNIDVAAKSGMDWAYPSMNNQAGEWGYKAAVDYAREMGVKIAPSIAVAPLGADLEMWKKRPEFYMWKKGDTKPSDALSYFFPEVRTWKARHLAEQVKKTGVDGLLLDYIRYPNEISGYEPAMVKAFKAETGRDANAISATDYEWSKFRAKYITMFISELRYELAQLDRPVEISVYVGPDWKSDLLTSMRDWRDWVRMGIVDKLCLGIYSRDFPSFYEGIRQAKATCPDRTKINIMIACWGGNLYTPELLKKGAEVSFAADPDEVSIYRGDGIDDLGLWPTIGEISRKYKK